MPVPREEVPNPQHTLAVQAVAARRRPVGKWSLILIIKGIVEIGDGRTIHVDRELSLFERQRGRKPYTYTRRRKERKRRLEEFLGWSQLLTRCAATSPWTGIPIYLNGFWAVQRIRAGRFLHVPAGGRREASLRLLAGQDTGLRRPFPARAADRCQVSFQRPAPVAGICLVRHLRRRTKVRGLAAGEPTRRRRAIAGVGAGRRLDRPFPWRLP